MSILWPIFLADFQAKATILAFIKPSHQAKIFYLQFLARVDAASSKNRNFQSNTQQYAVAEQATKVLHRYRRQNKQSQNF